MNIRLISLIAALGLGTAVAPAQTPFDSALKALLSADHGTRALEYNARAAATEARTAILPEGPDIDFDYKFGVGDAGNRWGLSVVQGFDWPGVYSHRRKAISEAERALQLAHTAYVESRRQQYSEMLIDLVLARRRCALLKTYSANVDSVYALYSKAYELGEATVLEMRKLKIEREVARSAYLSGKATATALQERIAALGGGSVGDLIDGLDDYPGVEIAPEFSESYPSLEALRALAEAGAAESRAARIGSIFPGLKVGYIHEKEGAEHFNGFTVGLSLPLWKGRGEARVAQAKASAAREEYEAALAKARGEFALRHSRAVSLAAQVAGLEQAIGDEAEYRRLLLKALEGGSITLLEYLQELNSLLDARLSLESCRAEACDAALLTHTFPDID